MRTVLISAPSLQPGNIYLPYVWGVLKSYAELDPELSGRFAWLDPVYLYRDDLESQLGACDERRIDVLGLSCYVWNWETQLEIAERVRHRSPECLVVAGGPQLSWREPGLIDRLGVDVIVKRDGEEPFRRLLRESLREQPDYRGIPNLILRGDVHTPDDGRPLELAGLPSPLLSNARAFHRFADEIRARGEHPHAMWETNRGCPFRCSFCDWGSATNSKLRRFDTGRLRAEADWFAAARIHTVFIADANFGISTRDAEIARWLAEHKAASGHPEYVLFNPTKNKQEVATQIANAFYDAGVWALNMLNFQHTREPVLRAIDRENIRIDKLMEPLRRGWRLHMPITAVLITGCPDDTLEQWKACHDDLLEWGFHEDILAFDFAVLPNAPAADPDYRERYGIETVYRRIPEKRIPKAQGAESPNRNFCDIIVATRSYDRADWVELKLFTALVTGFHNYGVTRFLALYLRHYHGVRYADFYGWLLAEGGGQPLLGEGFEELRRCLRAYLEDRDAELYVDCSDELSFRVPLEGALFLRAVSSLDAFLAEVCAVVRRHVDVDAGLLEDLARFQREMVITPDYAPRAGKCFSVRYNWVEVFARILSTRPLDVPELAPLRPEAREIEVRQTHSGHLKRTPLGFDDLEDYYQKIVRVGYMRSFTAYFRDVLLPQGAGDATAGGAPPAALRRVVQPGARAGGAA